MPVTGGHLSAGARKASGFETDHGLTPGGNCSTAPTSQVSDRLRRRSEISIFTQGLSIASNQRLSGATL